MTELIMDLIVHAESIQTIAESCVVVFPFQSGNVPTDACQGMVER